MPEGKPTSWCFPNSQPGNGLKWLCTCQKPPTHQSTGLKPCEKPNLRWELVAVDPLVFQHSYGHWKKNVVMILVKKNRLFQMGNLSLGDMIRDIETNQAACFSLGFGGQMVGSRQEKPNFQDENWRMTWMMQRGTPRFRTSEDRDESSPIICQFSMCSMCSIYDWGFELPEDLLFENWTAPGAPGAPDPMVLHERMTITRSPKGFLDRKVKNTWKLSKHHRTTLWLSPGIVNGWVHPVITVLSLLTLLIAMVPKQKRDRGMIRQVIIYQLFMYNPCITLQIPIKKTSFSKRGFQP